METIVLKKVSFLTMMAILFSTINLIPAQTLATDVQIDTATTTSVGNMTTTSVETTATISAANRLAELGIIEEHSANPVEYNVNSNITRREMLKVMINLSSETLVQNCVGSFRDLSASDWGCKYAETGLKAGFIAANTRFRPDDLVTEAEALKMIMQAKGLTKAPGVTDWAQAYSQAAVEANILIEGSVASSSDAATRAFTILTADATVSTTKTTDTNDDMDKGEDTLSKSKTYTIDITSDGFIPSTLTIQAGDRVNFTNKDTELHWPASAMHPIHTNYPGSGITKCGTNEQPKIFDACKGLAQGEIFSFVFNEKGDWGFHDHLHPSSFGKIIVQ